MKLSKQRHGNVLFLIAISWVVLLGMAALAVDLGYILLTKTQLQSASDSGSLAGGTELMPGLGLSAFRTPEEVEAFSKAAADEFVTYHRAGDQPAADILPSRDVRMGTAKLDIESGTWIFDWGAQPYNAVGVTTIRSDEGVSEADGPLPLIFARVLNHEFANVSADSVAVILPARGIRVPPGGGFNSALSPFAYELDRWKKYLRAKEYFDGNNLVDADLDQSVDGHLIMDAVDDSPLFYEEVEFGHQIRFRRLFGDKFGAIDPTSHNADNIEPTGDGILELNIYPINSEAGNFGTVDIGGLDNSTQVLKRQIRSGISAQDLADFEDNSITPSEDSPLILQGDTGISAGIQASLESIIGECRTVLLYSTVTGPGNNAEYTIVDMVGFRFMNVNLNANPKSLTVQPCAVSDPGGIPDFETEIGDHTTVFTSLILVK